MPPLTPSQILGSFLFHYYCYIYLYRLIYFHSILLVVNCLLNLSSNPSLFQPLPPCVSLILCLPSFSPFALSHLGIKPGVLHMHTMSKYCSIELSLGLNNLICWFWGRFSHTPYWPWTPNLPVSTSWIPGLQTCTATPNFCLLVCFYVVLGMKSYVC